MKQYGYYESNNDYEYHFDNSMIREKYKCSLNYNDFILALKELNKIPSIEKHDKRKGLILLIVFVLIVLQVVLIQNGDLASDFSFFEWYQKLLMFAPSILTILIWMIFGKSESTELGIDRTEMLAYSDFEINVKADGLFFDYEYNEMIENKFLRRRRRFYDNYYNYHKFLSYKCINSAQITQKAIFIFSIQDSCFNCIRYCIPRSAFNNDTEYEDFYNLISSYARK